MDPVAAGVAFLVVEDVVDGVVCERRVAALGMVACEFPVDEDLDGGGDEAELEANLVSHVTGGELHGLRERDHRVSGGRAFAPERVHGYRDLGGELADVWVLGVVVAESHGGGPHALELYVYNVQYLRTKVIFYEGTKVPSYEGSPTVRVRVALQWRSLRSVSGQPSSSIISCP